MKEKYEKAMIMNILTDAIVLLGGFRSVCAEYGGVKLYDSKQNMIAHVKLDDCGKIILEEKKELGYDRKRKDAS